MDSTLEYVWDKAVGGLHWLKEVVLGEFDDHRPTSAIVADMLVSFVPGVIIVTSARDLTAVVIRLVKHPQKREEVTEWMLVIGCAIPLILPVLAAAAGAAAAGVGSVVGALGGDEVGAALRAVCLMLIERGGEMLETLIKFLRKFIKGDVIDVLRHINFTQYSEDLVKYIRKFIDGLLAVTKKVEAELGNFTWFDSAKTAIARLKELEKGFYAVQEAAVKHIPGALGELQARLTKALAGESKALEHSATPMVHAPKPKVVPVEPRRVATMPGNPLGTPHGAEPPKGVPPSTSEQTNLHPQTKGDPPTAADDAKGITGSRLPNKALTKEGWPDLPASQAPNFVSADAVTLNPGDKIYRVIDDPSKAGGGYWSRELPANMTEWRSDYAVDPAWNNNGLYTEYTVPDGTSLNVWEGPASSQGSLPGGLATGKSQIWMPPGTLSPTNINPTGW